MADKKRKKPRKQTPQEHVKRQQAARKRARHHGQFAAGPHKLNAVFQHTHNMMRGHRSTWKDDFPPSEGDQQRIFSTTPYAKRGQPEAPSGTPPKYKPTLTEPKNTKKGKVSTPKVHPLPEGMEDNYTTLDAIVGRDVPNVSGATSSRVPPKTGPPNMDPDGVDPDILESRRNVAPGPGDPGSKLWQDNPDSFSSQATPEDPETTYRIIHEQRKAMYRNAGMPSSRADRLAHEDAELRTAALHGGRGPRSDYMQEQMSSGLTTRKENADELYAKGRGGPRNDPDTGEPMTTGRVAQERLWITHRGTFHGGQSPEGPLEYVPQQIDEENVFGRLPSEQQAYARKMPRDDRTKYLQLVSQGYSSREVQDWLDSGAPVSRTAPKGGYKRGGDNMDAYMEMAHGDLQNRRTGGQGGGMKDKYDPGYSHENFSHSMMAPGTDSLENLRKRFPSMPEGELVKYQHAQRMAITDYMLEENERWAHETRAARVKGQGDGKNTESSSDERVVFFTTNMGGPTASVSSDSLLGQYVIRKRKAMVVNDKQATRKEVKGQFPRAVRDQHLIEVSTGVSLGVRGQYGLFHNTGWKAGNKKSKGYGKHSAVGAQLLRDSTGQPIYDKDGNVRYTEGYTRTFDAGTNRDVGLRIFVG